MIFSNVEWTLTENEDFVIPEGSRRTNEAPRVTFDYFLLATSREGGDEFTRETDVIDNLLIGDWFQS